MAARMPGNGRFRGPEDDKFAFWATLTEMEDIIAASGQIEADTRERLGDTIGSLRQLVGRKRIRYWNRKRWLRSLKREVKRIRRSGLGSEEVQNLHDTLDRIRNDMVGCPDE